MASSSTNVELVYFTGCPSVETARANLREALTTRGLPPEWIEWNQLDGDVPSRLMGLHSPTVLVYGQDVSDSKPTMAMACRADGAPSVAEILEAFDKIPPSS